MIKRAFTPMLVVVILVGLGLGTALGYAFDSSRTSKNSRTGATQANQGATQAGQAQIALGQGRGAGAASNITVGTIDSIAGNAFNVKTQNGTTKVQVSDNTTIQKVVAGAKADLQVGQTLMVTGTAGSNGTIAATSITEAGSLASLGQALARRQGNATPAAGGQGAMRPQASGTPMAGGQTGWLQSAFGDTTTGVVESISDNVITLRTQGGSTKVQVSDSTTFRKLAAGTTADLQAGQSVTVVGAAGSDGTIAATLVLAGLPSTQ